MSSLKCWLRKINKQDKISKEELNENIDYCRQTITMCQMTVPRRRELRETLLSQRAMLTEFEKQIREDERRKFAEWILRKDITCGSTLSVKDLARFYVEDYEKENKTDM